MLSKKRRIFAKPVLQDIIKPSYEATNAQSRESRVVLRALLLKKISVVFVIEVMSGQATLNAKK